MRKSRKKSKKNTRKKLIIGIYNFRVKSICNVFHISERTFYRKIKSGDFRKKIEKFIRKNKRYRKIKSVKVSEFYYKNKQGAIILKTKNRKVLEKFRKNKRYVERKVLKFNLKNGNEKVIPLKLGVEINKKDVKELKKIESFRVGKYNIDFEETDIDSFEIITTSIIDLGKTEVKKEKKLKVDKIEYEEEEINLDEIPF